MRLIDGDALIEKYGDWYMEEGTEEGYIGTIAGLIDAMPTIEERKTGKWSGFWSEPQNDDSVYGEKLNEGDTIYLFGVEGTVRQECGAWGWGSPRYVPWEELEKRMPHNNCPDFCYCDNFISFWELKWNFDDGYDWDGVPFIRHDADMRQEGEDNECE